MIENFCKWLESQPFAAAISESGWLFPTIETVHVLALTLVVGSIAMVDLRLLNLAYRNQTVKEISREVLPWTWAAFGIAAMFGGLLFSSAATKYYGIATFRAKIALMALAGLNMLFFHLVTCRNVDEWGDRAQTPLPAKISGGVSLVLWAAIVALGRWTGFA
jgi:hypothetical protein